jgi:hypothetical protein
MYKCECGSLFDKPKTIYWEDEQWDECPQCKATNYEPLKTNNMNLESVEKYTKAIVTIEYNEESYEVCIQENFNGNHDIEVLNLETNDCVDDDVFEQQLIDFAYECINNK